MRNTFVNTLFDIAKKDKNVQLITGDLGFGVLTKFSEELPGQFINAGVCEQNMTGVAAGMGLEGKNVFTYSIGNFPTLRAIEQVRNDIAYHKSNVTIVCVGGGFAYGALGMSHHATEDLAIMRALPEMTIFSPCDPIEVDAVTKAAYSIDGPCYIRLGKGGEKNIHKKTLNFKIGKAYKIIDGDNIAIFCTGSIIDEAIKAAELLKSKKINVTVYSFPTIKPIDKKTIIKCANDMDLIITLEEHNIIGGLGGAVAEVMAENKGKAILNRMGLNDEFSSVVGNQSYLRNYYNIDSNAILKLIMNYVRRGK